MLSTTHTLHSMWDLICISLTNISKPHRQQAFSQPLSHLLSVQLDLEASPLRFGSQILSMMTTCLGLTRMNRTLHHLMGIYVLSKIFHFVFVICSLLLVYSLVERTLSFESFLQKSHRRYDLFGESFFLLHPLSLSSYLFIFCHSFSPLLLP